MFNFARVSLAAALAVSALGAARASEMFQLARSPGGVAFWHLQRADARRSDILVSFRDTFALRNPARIATPLVGASLLQSGPKGMSSGEFNEFQKDLRASCGVGATTMSSGLTVESRPEDLGEALELCLRTVTEPALRDIDVERMRKATVVNRERLATDRGALAALLMRRLTNFNSPFGRWGEPVEILKITAADVDDWRREVFARDNMTVVAIGTQDAAAFGAIIDRGFRVLPEKAAVHEGDPPAPVYPDKVVVMERAGAQTAVVLEGALGIDNADGPAISVASNVLGGGLDRRLSKAVRGEQGATYGISSSIGLVAPGQRTFAIRSQLANDLARAGIQRARDEYEKWRVDGVSEDEAAGARDLLATNYEKGGETPHGKAASLLSMLRTGRTAGDEATYAERTRAVTAGEINKLLREKAPKKLTTVIVATSAEGFGADCVIRAIEEVDRCK